MVLSVQRDALQQVQQRDAFFRCQWCQGPVRAALHRCARSTVQLAEEVKAKIRTGNGLRLVADATIEIEGEDRPAVVARFLNRFYK